MSDTQEQQEEEAARATVRAVECETSEARRTRLQKERKEGALADANRRIELAVALLEDFDDPNPEDDTLDPERLHTEAEVLADTLGDPEELRALKQGPVTFGPPMRV